LAEYGALSYFGVQTFTTAIFRSWLNMGDRSSAALIAVLLLLLMVCLMSAESWARGRARFYTHSGRAQKSRRKPLKKMMGLLVSVLCLSPSILGFFAPVAFLLRLVHVSHTDPAFDMPWQRFFLWAWHSVSLGLLAAAVALLLSIALAYARRQDSGWLVRLIHRAVSLGYGVPGAIIAIAILIPLSRADVVLTDYFHLASPLFAGGIAGLIYAYTVRFTSAALQSVDTGLQRITPFIDDSARTLGYSVHQVWWRVHLPILKGAFGAGGLLVLVDVMKELPATLVLRPFDFDTLAVVSYQFAADERLAEAALPALAIVLVALVPMLLLIKQSSQK
jgi:iron(III) transport system permease protein